MEVFVDYLDMNLGEVWQNEYYRLRNAGHSGEESDVGATKKIREINIWNDVYYNLLEMGKTQKECKEYKESAIDAIKSLQEELEEELEEESKIDAISNSKVSNRWSEIRNDVDFYLLDEVLTPQQKAKRMLDTLSPSEFWTEVSVIMEKNRQM